MTREHKLALIVGFSLVLVLAVLLSDHFSPARKQAMAEGLAVAQPSSMGVNPEGLRMAREAGQNGTVPGTGTARVGASPGEQLMQTRSPLPGINRPEPTVIANRGEPSNPPAMSALTHLDEVPLPKRESPGTVTPIQMGEPPVQTGSASTETTGMPGTQPEVNYPLQRHDVREGDAAFSIARRYYGNGKFWEKLRDYNKDRMGRDGDLRVGVTLLIPPKEILEGKPYSGPQVSEGASRIAESRPEARSSESATREPAREAAKDPKFREYTVQSGDTLASIARKMLGSTGRWEEIRDANRGVNPENLRVGSKIRVPQR